MTREAHKHTAVETPRKGAIGDCVTCGLPLIHDGRKWRWLFDLSSAERNKLRKEWPIR